ncbi:ABC-type Fe3+-hydroxamate transport system substrate-binding protein [Halarchaeum solikamskense]|uniref:ABC transporter substrate-binding protein n=1 Tax=Halarchaeum nitratireducens TaxID=489913 RepID=UPI001B3AA076|nr:ABC transporter substrate-binding protein [Halarchaeum solikamskense]MBP2251084.1 ABC-type Fe3+-hydroxamate transport system substrate-binding protein [Halarchaeum solikamskense]
MTSRDTTTEEVSTRRDVLKGGGAIVGGGLLAGCVGTTSNEPTSTAATSDASTDTATTATGSYAVTLSPVGDVEFDSVPSDFLTYYPLSAGTAVALGHGESINAIGYDKQLFGNTVSYYYDRLESVTFEWEDLGRVTSADDPGVLDMEAFYELDSDVHFLDPALLRSSSFGWSEEDIDAIAEDVGPWFGNYYSRTNADPPDAYRDGYEYYTLWEYIEKIAAVLREEERYQAFKSMRDDLVARIQANLPPESERPSVAIVAYSGGTFWPYDFTQDGYIWAHVRPMGIENAFETIEGGLEADGSYDFEALVEAQPDVMLRYWGTALGETFIRGREAVLDNPLADDIPALRDERYYPSGYGMQGPIMSLFNLEMTAKQLYPDQFGEWPGYGSGELYPEISESEQLFDRQAVVDIVSGEI